MIFTLPRELQTRIIDFSHWETFYDIGGVIREDVQYLVGLRNVNDGSQAYVLDEVPDGLRRNVFWGELAQDVVAAVETLDQ